MHLPPAGRGFRFFSSLLLLAGCLSAAPQTGDAGKLAGLWEMDQTFGTQVSGPVTLLGGAPPVAEAAGFAVPGVREAGGWLFAFPNGRGELHCSALDGVQVAAMWVQPALPSGSKYATPAALTEIAGGTWRGRLAPLENHVFMTMHVERNADGSVIAFLRDPLFNTGRQFGVMRVALAHGKIDFVSQKRGTLIADLDDTQLNFALHFEGLGLPPFQFHRSLDDAPAPASAYREPVATGDGWPIASAAGAGLSTASLETLTQRIASTPVLDATSPAVHSLAIARHGKLVFDRYFAGFDESIRHDTRSAGKTYADLLAGAAIFAGAPFDDTTALLALYPSYLPVAHDDPRKHAIAVGNALSMTTGLDCDGNDEKSVANEDTMQSQTRQPDWYRLVLDAPMVRDPGAKSVYCSASINLAGGAIAGATRAWLPLYFEERVAEPLDMQSYALNLMPGGQWYLGGGAYVRPRDFLKIGQVFLDGGRWNGRQIVSPDWIARSWKKRSSFDGGDDYGYAWHLRTFAAGVATYRVFEAQGNGGQILDVVPSLDLAVMMTQGNYNNYLTWGKTRDALLLGVITSIEST